MKNFFELQPLILPAIGVLLVVLFFLVVITKIKRWFRIHWARRQHELDLEEMRERWKRIERLLNSPEIEGDRLAVIEADKLLDFVLQRMHFPGQTFAYRMQIAQKKYFELKRVRWAHELRNKLVHEPDIRLQAKQSFAAVKEYQRALRSLGAL